VLRRSPNFSLEIKYTNELVNKVCIVTSFRDLTTNKDLDLDLEARKFLIFKLLYTVGTARAVSDNNSLTVNHKDLRITLSIGSIRSALNQVITSPTLRGFAKALSTDPIIVEAFNRTIRTISDAGSSSQKLAAISTDEPLRFSNPCLLKKFFNKLADKNHSPYLCDCIDDNLYNTPEQVKQIKNTAIRK